MGNNFFSFGDSAALIRNTVKPEDSNGAKYIGLEHIERGTLHLNGYGSANDVSSAKSQFRTGDILFGKLRPYFRKVVRAPFDGVCSTDIWVVRAKEGIDQGFLYYWMASQEFVNFSMQGSEGTKMPRAKWEHVSRHKIPYFALPEQRAIAHILGSLDDKIKLNRQMNRTLEKMAQAIFKSWFIDFDPVRAKAEGRDPGLPKEIADLFPNSFEDSELGPIPKGWKVRSIGEAVQCVGGSTPSTKNPKYWDGGTNPFVTPKDMSSLTSPVILGTERHITYAGVEKISSRQLPVGTVLLSSRAPIGYLAITEIPVSVNQGIIAMICNGDLPNHYVLQWTRTNMDIIKSNAGGTTFAEISKRNFRPIPVVIPPLDPLDAFVDQVGPLHQQLVLNCLESRELTAIRDTLLPKLISGELRVPDAEKLVEGMV